MFGAKGHVAKNKNKKTNNKKTKILKLFFTALNTTTLMVEMPSKSDSDIFYV